MDKKSQKKLYKKLTYIENKFGNSSSNNYHIRVEELIKLLQIFPELGTEQIGHNNLRGIILYRRTTILYKYDSDVIKIINVVDNRWKK